VDDKRQVTDFWWTTSDLAEAAGVTDAHIRRLCIEGRLECQKLGGRWVIWNESARRWLASDRKPGPKPAGTRPTGEQLELDLDND